jgi:hypothetical protein
VLVEYKNYSLLVNITCSQDELPLIASHIDKIGCQYNTKLDPWANQKLYLRRKYYEDPVFRERTLATNNERNKKRYADDPEYRLKLQLQRRERYQLQKLKAAGNDSTAAPP